MKKIAVCSLLYQGQPFNSPILAVSRKDNHHDFGLPGGKLETNESLYQCLERELFEETGLTILQAIPFSFKEEPTYITIVYLVTAYQGIIQTTEKGVVAWVDFDTLKAGSFGQHCTQLEAQIEKLKNLFSPKGKTNVKSNSSEEYSYNL